jgi:bifunctional non-homologous end joining protein LigD
MNKLTEYIAKRHQDQTPEPFTSDDIDKERFVFVIQKHDATALHYDLRLEVDGAMPSWAVPKGPTLDPAFKRLAMQTEDHPMDYRHFEGIIPEGNYGAGPVIVWDEGYYLPEIETAPGVRQQIKDKKEGEKVMQAGLEKGEIKFFLDGKKLKGSFALVKTKGFPPGKSKNAWLLIKHKDEYCQEGYDAKDYEKSAKSGKTLKDLG